MTSREHIFCIGLNKTGTLSLHKAISELGFHAAHHSYKGQLISELIQANLDTGKPALHGMDELDCILDFYPTYFRTLHEQYPGSKFILTTRDKAEWIQSRTLHVQRNQKDPDYRGGWLRVEQDAWSAEWDHHHTEVLRYFGHMSNFLVVDICSGEGYQVLCPFLGVPQPEGRFPHINKTPS